MPSNDEIMKSESVIVLCAYIYVDTSQQLDSHPRLSDPNGFQAPLLERIVRTELPVTHRVNFRNLDISFRFLACKYTPRDDESRYSTSV